MNKLESCSAWIMLINGTLGLLVSVGSAVLYRPAASWIESLPCVSLLGVLAGLLAVRAASVGLVAGAIFYGLQIVSYYSKDLELNFKSGISYAVIVNLPHGVLVINMFALAGLLVIGWILAQRYCRHLATQAD